MQLQKTLKTLLQRKGLTYKQLGEATGISPNTIKTWISGSTPHRLEDVRRVARYLEVSFEFLVFGADDNQLPKSLEEIVTKSIYKGWVKISVEIPTDDKKKSQSSKGET